MLLSLTITEDFGGKIIADDTDFVILVALKGLVRDGVNMKGGLCWLASHLAKLVAKSFLGVVVEIVLSTEEDYATLGH
jgi:hypothetical protein